MDEQAQLSPFSASAWLIRKSDGSKLSLFHTQRPEQREANTHWEQMEWESDTTGRQWLTVDSDCSSWMGTSFFDARVDVKRDQSGALTLDRLWVMLDAEARGVEFGCKAVQTVDRLCQHVGSPTLASLWGHTGGNSPTTLDTPDLASEFLLGVELRDSGSKDVLFSALEELESCVGPVQDLQTVFTREFEEGELMVKSERHPFGGPAYTTTSTAFLIRKRDAKQLCLFDAASIRDLRLGGDVETEMLTLPTQGGRFRKATLESTVSFWMPWRQVQCTVGSEESIRSFQIFLYTCFAGYNDGGTDDTIESVNEMLAQLEFPGLSHLWV